MPPLPGFPSPPRPQTLPPAGPGSGVQVESWFGRLEPRTPQGAGRWAGAQHTLRGLELLPGARPGRTAGSLPRHGGAICSLEATSCFRGNLLRALAPARLQPLLSSVQPGRRDLILQGPSATAQSPVKGLTQSFPVNLIPLPVLWPSRPRFGPQGL